jgi:hypothetical protein
MPHKKSFWYQVGFALEKARAPEARGRALASLADRVKPSEKKPSKRAGKPVHWPTADELVSSGTAALTEKVLDAWQPRERSGLGRLIRAGVAGAAAAFLVEMVRPLIDGERLRPPTLDRDMADRLMVGAGQGLVYGGVVEPRLPGPSVVRGALYGSAEYAVDPMGGISHLLGRRAPQARLPLVGHLLEDLDRHDRAYVEHVVFGIALAVLYGSAPSGNGVRIEDEG